MTKPGERPTLSLLWILCGICACPVIRLSRVVQASDPAPAAVSSVSAPADADFDWSEADRMYLHRHVADNLERSISLAELRLAKNPADPQALWRWGRGLVRLGERRQARGDKLAAFERARKILERSIEIDPAFSESHFWLGLALGRIGQTRGVLKSLFLIGPIRRQMQKTLEIDPHHGGAHHVLGEMLRQLPGFAGGSKKSAVAELEKAVALGPAHTAHYPALARAYLEVGERAKAVETLRKLFYVKSPDDPGEHADHIQDAHRMLHLLGAPDAGPRTNGAAEPR